MAEFTNISLQTVATNQNVVFTESPVPASGCVQHREGSGIVTLRGNTSQCRARFKVSFGANIAIPDGGAAGQISTAIAIAGEALPSATAIVTPAAAAQFFNIFVESYIDVPRGCCLTVSVKNTSTQEISVQNANIIIERVC